MAAPYQLAHDGFDGKAFSGVIKADGTWVPCMADCKDWDEYVKWVSDPKADPPHVPDPWKSPEDGGVAIKLTEDEVAVGSMLMSLPVHKEAPPAHTPPPAHVPPSPPPAAPRTGR